MYLLEFLESLNIWQSYGEKFIASSALFFRYNINHHL